MGWKAFRHSSSQLIRSSNTIRAEGREQQGAPASLVSRPFARKVGIQAILFLAPFNWCNVLLLDLDRSTTSESLLSESTRVSLAQHT